MQVRVPYPKGKKPALLLVKKPVDPSNRSGLNSVRRYIYVDVFRRGEISV